jgi:hypothetical protein
MARRVSQEEWDARAAAAVGIEWLGELSNNLAKLVIAIERHAILVATKCTDRQELAESVTV